MEPPQQEIEERRDEERGRAEQVRGASSEHVGDHAGRDFKQHLACREEGVRRKGLRDAQPRIEQEQGVDPPDERGRERRQKRERDVGPKDPDVCGALLFTRAGGIHDRSD